MVIAVLKLIGVPFFDRRWAVLITAWISCFVVGRLAGLYGVLRIKSVVDAED